MRGRVDGSTSARKVKLCAPATCTETLVVEACGFFEGKCRRSDTPLADAPETQKVNQFAPPAGMPRDVDARTRVLDS